MLCTLACFYSGLSKTAYMDALNEAMHVFRGSTVFHNSRLSSWPESVVCEAATNLTEFARAVDKWCEELRAASEGTLILLATSTYLHMWEQLAYQVMTTTNEMMKSAQTLYFDYYLPCYFDLQRV